MLIVNNKQIKEMSSVGDLFTRSFWHVDEGIEDKSRNFYRPLIMMTYALDYFLYGLNPKGFHFTNIFAHLICAFLVYILTIKLLKDPNQAFIATLIWAIHPTHVENVSWICGRTDAIAGIFYFISLILFLKWLTGSKRPWITLLAACASYAVSLHAKEMAITLPILLGLAYLLLRKNTRPVGSLSVGFALVAIITIEYLVVRQVVLGHVASSTLSHAWGDVLRSLPLVFTQYIGLVFGFVPVDPHHAETVLKSVWSLPFAGYTLIVVAYALGLFVAWYRRQYTLLFCLLWFPVTLIPVFMLGSFGDILYADRFLYIPPVGLISAAVIVIYGFVMRKGKVVRGAAIGLFAIYVIVNIAYSRTSSAYWKDDLSLFSQAVRTSPDSAYIHFNLGNILSYAESYPKALESYNKAIALHPGYAEAYNNKAFVLNRLERHKEALACINRVILLRGVNETTLTNMGDAFMGLGDRMSAEKCYRGALALKETAFGHHQLALCLMAQKKLDAAHDHFVTALSMKRNPRILKNLGKLSLSMGNPDQALIYLTEALSRLKGGVPSHIKVDIHYHMARALLARQRPQAARDHMQEVRKLLSLGYGTPSVREEIILWLGEHGMDGSLENIGHMGKRLN